MKNTKFYACTDCVAVLKAIHDSVIVSASCTMRMDQLIPSAVEATVNSTARPCARTAASSLSTSGV